MIEDRFNDYGNDHILLPEEFLEEVVPGYHADMETLYLELHDYQRANKETLA